jgi:hypothetical protein
MQTIDNAHYKVLQIIYSIVKDDPYPLKYYVHPRELILRSMQDWSEIQLSLTALENEEFVITRRLDTLQISITEQGFNLCRSSIHK